MSERYRVVRRPHVELFSIRPGEALPSKPINQHCFRVEDSQAGGDYVGEPYVVEEEAQAACAELNAR